ncbi:hypothetical protein J3459_006691 [Metarhizium acridum]|nr:hypothetical protein J3459_006691 [Metarhizium acridum]
MHQFTVASPHWRLSHRGASCFGVTNTHDGAKGFIGYGITLYEPFCAWPLFIRHHLPRSTVTDEDLANTAREKRSERSVPDERAAEERGCGCRKANPCTPREQVGRQGGSSLPLQELEAFMRSSSPVRISRALAPEYHSYSTLVATVTSVPTQPLNASVILDYTAYIPDETYNIYYNTMYTYAKSEKRGSWYAMVHDTPVWGLGVVPTRGQAILLLYMWVINVVATVQGIDYAFPSSLYSTTRRGLQDIRGNRTGVMSCALFPLVMLYAGRNNLLLLADKLVARYVSSDSSLDGGPVHAACRGSRRAVPRHRPVEVPRAVVCRAKLPRGTGNSAQLRYWPMVILCLISVQIVRRKAYELFLVLHILLAVVALAGAFFHIISSTPLTMATRTG